MKTMSRIDQIKYALTDEERASDRFPSMRRLSAAFMYGFVPLPDERKQPEYVQVPSTSIEERLFVSEWNWAWEAGYLRSMRDENDLPYSYKWLARFQGHNLYLLPGGNAETYHRYAPLYHLLPLSTLERFGLPTLHRGLWPFVIDTMHSIAFPAGFRLKLERAWSSHIWPHLLGDRRHARSAFSDEDPIALLSHDLDYWLPHAYTAIEDLVQCFERVPLGSDKLRAQYDRIRSSPDIDGLQIGRPRRGGDLWIGEEQARDITASIVDFADGDGRLRAIIDAIRTNRQQDDFSTRWSRAREDFERSFHHTRAKVKVIFVELPGTVPIQGPDAEIDLDAGTDPADAAVTNVVWEDLMSAVDPKTRRVVVLLRSGMTRVGEISRLLGYANHSPVSKKLRKIQSIAERYFAGT
jgi:hypothetical protein